MNAKPAAGRCLPIAGANRVRPLACASRADKGGNGKVFSRFTFHISRFTSFIHVSLSIFIAAASLATPSLAAKKPAKPPAFGESAAVREFIAEVSAKHQFDEDGLARRFAGIRVNQAVLRAIRPAAVAENQRSWPAYRARFLTDARREQGLRFRAEHAAALARAEAIYGVPWEIVVAIIGVETQYGRNAGKFGVLEALATLAFEYPPRAAFFRRELEEFLLMAREDGRSPLDYKGSYAGAIGIPQFMPSSQRAYAVDFDGDGRVDLRTSAIDAIGSVARYLNVHGWREGAPVAAPASVSPEAAALAEAGNRPSMPLKEMRERGAEPRIEAAEADRLADAPAALIDLPAPDEATEYWIGFDNFYVITRYNHSSFYAMAVYQLAESLREAAE